MNVDSILEEIKDLIDQVVEDERFSNDEVEEFVDEVIKMLKKL